MRTRAVNNLFSLDDNNTSYNRTCVIYLLTVPPYGESPSCPSCVFFEIQRGTKYVYIALMYSFPSQKKK